MDNFESDELRKALESHLASSGIDEQQRQEWGESQPQMVPKDVLEAREKRPK